MLPEILRESAVHPGPVASVYLEVHRTEEVWARNARDFAADVDRAVSTLHAGLVRCSTTRWARCCWLTTRPPSCGSGSVRNRSSWRSPRMTCAGSVHRCSAKTARTRRCCVPSPAAAPI